MDFEDRNNLYKIRKTVLEMLNDRGYIIDNNLELTFEEFTSMYNNNNINIHLNDEKLGQIYIYFHKDILFYNCHLYHAYTQSRKSNQTSSFFFC